MRLTSINMFRGVNPIPANASVYLGMSSGGSPYPAADVFVRDMSFYNGSLPLAQIQQYYLTNRNNTYGNVDAFTRHPLLTRPSIPTQGGSPLANWTTVPLGSVEASYCLVFRLLYPFVDWQVLFTVQRDGTNQRAPQLLVAPNGR